jgi:hypothetical protein
LASNAQAIRTILLASATATTLNGRRARSCVSQGYGRCHAHAGVPEHILSDNGAEMTAKVVRNWLMQVGAKILFIEPGSP